MTLTCCEKGLVGTPRASIVVPPVTVVPGAIPRGYLPGYLRGYPEGYPRGSRGGPGGYPRGTSQGNPQSVTPRISLGYTQYYPLNDYKGGASIRTLGVPTRPP